MTVDCSNEANCENEAGRVTAAENIQLNDNEQRDEAGPRHAGRKSLPDLAGTPVQPIGRASRLRMPLFRR